MTVTDASVWVSRFLKDDDFHATSVTWLEQQAGGGLALAAPVTMLAEVAGAISRRSGNTQLGYQIARRIRQVPTLQLVSIDSDLGEFAAEVASSYRLRGADALYVAVAQRLQMPLVSWDREQIERAGRLVEALLPPAPARGEPGGYER